MRKTFATASSTICAGSRRRNSATSISSKATAISFAACAALVHNKQGQQARKIGSMILSGIHPVAEALRAGTPVERLLVAQGAGGPRLQEIIDLARRKGTPVRFEQRSALDRIAGTTAHQGVVALG